MLRCARDTHLILARLFRPASQGDGSINTYGSGVPVKDMRSIVTTK
jgi:hypothetical protein